MVMAMEHDAELSRLTKKQMDLVINKMKVQDYLHGETVIPKGHP
jgi:hypothetical protein